MILIDTNVISEYVRPRPDPTVLKWFADSIPGSLHLSAVTMGEIYRGIKRMPDSKRRAALWEWASQNLLREFAGRILPYDHAAACVWGEIMAHAEHMGRPRPPLDAQIAAIALAHGLTLATRNKADFAGLGLKIVNPWH